MQHRWPDQTDGWSIAARRQAHVVALVTSQRAHQYCAGLKPAHAFVQNSSADPVAAKSSFARDRVSKRPRDIQHLANTVFGAQGDLGRDAGRRLLRELEADGGWDAVHALYSGSLEPSSLVRESAAVGCRKCLPILCQASHTWLFGLLRGARTDKVPVALGRARVKPRPQCPHVTTVGPVPRSSPVVRRSPG